MEMSIAILTIPQAFLAYALDVGNLYPQPLYLLRFPIGWKESPYLREIVPDFSVIKP
jgi:hypothetical protein